MDCQGIYFFLSEKRKEKWKKGKERLEATTSTISDIFYLFCQGNYVFFFFIREKEGKILGIFEKKEMSVPNHADYLSLF